MDDKEVVKWMGEEWGRRMDLQLHLRVGRLLDTQEIEDWTDQ